MEDKNLELLEQASVPKAILKLSLPTVLSTVVSLLYNLTDTYFIRLLDDPVQLGAISLAFPVFLVIQAIGNVFGNGAPSYISRCLGARRMEEVKRAGCVSVYIAVLATLGMTLLYFCFQQPVLRLLGTSPDTIGPTGEYLGIVVGFSAVMTMQVILSALLRAESRIKEAAAGVIIGTVLNVVFDPVFIFVFRLGVAGAAWATIIGNACAAGYYLIVYQKRGTALSLAPQDFRPSRRILGEVLKIGLPASAAQILMSFCTVLVNNLAAGYGDYVISAYGVAGKLSNMVYMLVLGYVSGYMPFAGYHYGAGNWERMLEAFRFTWITATGGGAGPSGALSAAGPSVYGGLYQCGGDYPGGDGVPLCPGLVGSVAGDTVYRDVHLPGHGQRGEGNDCQFGAAERFLYPAHFLVPLSMGADRADLLLHGGGCGDDCGCRGAGNSSAAETAGRGKTEGIAGLEGRAAPGGSGRETDAGPVGAQRPFAGALRPEPRRGETKKNPRPEKDLG